MVWILWYTFPQTVWLGNKDTILVIEKVLWTNFYQHETIPRDWVGHISHINF